MWAIERIKTAVAQNNIPPLSLWYGEERYLIQEGLVILKDHYLGQDPSGSGIEMISGREYSPVQIIEKANTAAFFAQKLLIVDEIPYFQDGQSDLEPFYDYFANPNPQTCLVFIADKINKGRKFFKEISQKGLVIEFALPSRPQEWQQWVMERVQARGKKISPSAAQFFIEWAGHQVGILDQELEKLTVFIGERQEITSQDIQAITPPVTETTIFNLLDAVAERNGQLALKRLDEVLQNDDPLKVLTMITRQVRLLLGTLAIRQKGGSKEDCMRVLEIRSPYEAQKIFTQSAKTSYKLLSNALKQCLDANLALKSSVGDKRLVLEMLVINFCRY